MSRVNGCLLKGSILEFSRCLTITGRSTIIPLGRRTGSSITVSIIGSERRQKKGVCLGVKGLCSC